jgi:hypothetical protein
MTTSSLVLHFDHLPAQMATTLMAFNRGDLLISKYPTIQYCDPSHEKWWRVERLVLMVFLGYHEIWAERYMYVLVGEQIFVVSSGDVSPP